MHRSGLQLSCKTSHSRCQTSRRITLRFYSELSNYQGNHVQEINYPLFLQSTLQRAVRPCTICQPPCSRSPQLGWTNTHTHRQVEGNDVLHTGRRGFSQACKGMLSAIYILEMRGRTPVFGSLNADWPGYLKQASRIGGGVSQSQKNLACRPSQQQVPPSRALNRGGKSVDARRVWVRRGAVATLRREGKYRTPPQIHGARWYHLHRCRSLREDGDPPRTSGYGTHTSF